MKKIIQLFKNETVLCAALVLAAASMIFVHPDKAYLGYIDFRTICILFSLMAVMEGFKTIGVFSRTAERLLRTAKSLRSILVILVSLCFFFSMLITNDVALITFVPFTITIFGMLGKEASSRLLVPTVVMETLAANLGSMLTPLGNPQNLYLYGISGLGLGEFILLLLPYALLAFVLLMIWIFIAADRSKTTVELPEDHGSIAVVPLAVYILLFAVCLLSVAKVLHFAVTAAIVLIALLIIDRSILKRVDYSLLLTFAGFFIFIGNMGRINAVNSFIRSIINGSEFLTALAASQIISNVPAALLLSGFTDNCRQLILGTDIGGLGTLIASMASLISFKCIAKEKPDSKKRYFIVFTAANAIFLLFMLGMYFTISNL